MKLNKTQVEALNELVKNVQSLHEQWEAEGEGGYYGDTKDTILINAEEFVLALGEIDKLIHEDE